MSSANMDGSALLDSSHASDTCDKKIKRTVNWTRDEEEILMMEVENRREVIEGRWQRPGSLTGLSVTKSTKHSAWAAVQAAINSHSANARSVEEIKKKFSNIKSKGKNNAQFVKSWKQNMDSLIVNRFHAKRKESESRHPPTGGGPPRSPLTPAEEIFVNAHGDDPSVKGIVEGLDTDLLQLVGDIPASYSLSTSGILDDQRASSAPNKMPPKRKIRDTELSTEALRLECEANKSIVRKNNLLCEVLMLKKRVLCKQLGIPED